MAKLLIVDTNGYALDFAMRCQAVGHEVRWFMRKEPKSGDVRKIGMGLIKRVTDWEDHAKWADIIFCPDNAFFMQRLDYYRTLGCKVFGPTDATANWELERGTGQGIFEACGIPTIPTTEFDDYDEAIAFVKKTMKRYVSKPSGDADKALSYCSKSPRDMWFMLERWKRLDKIKSPFILQEFTKGIEMAVGGWFGGGEFHSHVLENWEFKKLMNGDLGVATGEQGTVLHYTQNSLLAEKVLYPLQHLLAHEKYTGYVDVNCIIDSKGNPWPLEFTMRPGWPLFCIQQALHKGDPLAWMIDLLDGRHTLKVKEDVAVGVVVSQPDYPYSHLTKKEVTGIPIYGVTDRNKGHVHFCEAMAGVAPDEVNGKLRMQNMIVTAGDYILVASGTGPTVCEAAEKAYAVVEDIELPNSPMYRTDIGQRLESQLPELHKMGYAEDVEYE